MRSGGANGVVGDLLARGARVRAYDPVASHEAQRIFAGETGIEFVGKPMEALQGAVVLAIVTEWKEFRAPDFAAIKAALKTPAIFDGRNLYQPAVPRRAGLEYFAVGRL